MSYANLKRMLQMADAVDYREGQLAYVRYHELLAKIANKYGFDLAPTVAAFAALSPNNDYYGNLRSLVSVLDGINNNTPRDRIVISTYNACRNRALNYARGETDFVSTVRGPKIRSFYFNIMDPADKRHVTVDGHMVAAYRANNGTMKQNLVKPRDYVMVADTLKRLARNTGLIPNQAQAIIWFTRKRVLNVKYDAQLDLFAESDNQRRTIVDIGEIKPYAPR